MIEYKNEVDAIIVVFTISVFEFSVFEHYLVMMMTKIMQESQYQLSLLPGHPLIP